jgi:superfamily II DNA or RNA helicase
MQIIVNNDFTTISGATQQLIQTLQSELTYTDKSKQYQLRRLSKSVWGRASALYKQLQQEVHGKLYEMNGNDIVVSSAFYGYLQENFSSDMQNAQIVDNRKETGKKIVVPWLKKPYPLRLYQQEAVDLMLSNYRGVINFATGLGKTLVATHLVQQYKKRTLVVCPSDSVAKQFYKQFIECFGKNKVGFYGGGKKQISDITVGIAASVSKYIAEFQAADLGMVIFDETHHTPATTFFDIAEGLRSVGKVFGLTATDYRSDGKDIMITAGCGHVLIRRDIKWGVENGFLAEPYFIVREIDTGGRDFKDDKLKSYKEHVLNNIQMKSRIENDARSMMASGKAVLILVDEVAHGEELSKALGIPFATGLDKKSQDYVDQLNAHKIQGLIGTDGKISEGTDTKNVDVLILANFVASKGPVTQCIGRALRRQNLKTKALILDYVPMGSTMLKRHALQRINYYLEITDKVKHIVLNVNE